MKALLPGVKSGKYSGNSQGGVAEWLGRGLQNLVLRFNSGRRLQTVPSYTASHGRMAQG